MSSRLVGSVDDVVGGTKVNGHMATGGPDALVAQLEDFTDLTIDYWMLTTLPWLRAADR